MIRSVQAGCARKLNAYGVLYLFSVMMVEVNFHVDSLNVGNLFLSFSSMLLVLKTYFVDQRRILKPDFTILLAVLGFYVVILCLLFMSVFWSKGPLVTFVQAAYALCIFMGACAISRYDFLSVVGWIVKIFSILALFSLVSIILLPSAAFQEFSSTGYPELRGVFKHQQRLGLNMAAALGVFFFLWRSGWLRDALGVFWYKYRYIMFGGILICFLGAQARLFSVFFLIAILFCLIYSSYPRFLLAISLSVLVGLFFNFSYIDDFLSYYDGEMTLTGRTMIWSRVYSAFFDNFYLGHGFAVFDTHYFDYMWSEYRPPHAHNSYLQILFDLGILGGVVGLLCLLQMYLVFHKIQIVSGNYSIGMFLFFLCFASSFTGVIFFGKPSTIFTLMLMFLLLESRHYLYVGYKRL